uniref:CBF1-interacting co-repressor CIR N-terminal domain-containing protein n=1 Tax=Davidia involucrata TaxID=16924 RepID=A0A5B7BDQ2_DAVIN
MALKFLNKKGWHTGSLRNIENVWKAEQKHDAEQKKLEELRKQIQEERERSEFRLLQEQAGLVPKQERLDFLYDSGLAVGKGSSDGFKALEAFPKSYPETAASSSAKQQQPSVAGALFEEKPQSANDAWRKLHSDPLLLIRQREQEALARVKNNPIQMAMIRKSVEANKHEETSDRKERKKLHHKEKQHQKQSSPKHHLHSENVAVLGEERRNRINRKSSKYDEHLYKAAPNSEEFHEGDIRRNKNSGKDLKYKEQPPSGPPEPTTEQSKAQDRIERNHDKSKHYEGQMDSKSARKGREDRSSYQANRRDSPDRAPLHESHHKRRNIPIKLSEEERAARLQEMQMDAELHEERRWKRLRKAEADDAREATRARMSSGRNFLDAAKKSVYGAEKGGSSTIEESVRRRTHYLQGRSEVGEGNAFRR